MKYAYPCFLRLNNSVTLCFPDGYTVEDIMLYWEGDENAIQGTEKLQIPQFNLLGKIITRKEEVFYTGESDCFLVSYLLSLWYPGKLLGTSALDLYTLHSLLSYFFLSLEPLKNTLHKILVAYSLQIRKWVWSTWPSLTLHRYKGFMLVLIKPGLLSGPVPHPPSVFSFRTCHVSPIFKFQLTWRKGERKKKKKADLLCHTDTCHCHCT